MDSDDSKTSQHQYCVSAANDTLKVPYYPYFFYSFISMCNKCDLGFYDYYLAEGKIC